MLSNVPNAMNISPLNEIFPWTFISPMLQLYNWEAGASNVTPIWLLLFIAPFLLLWCITWRSVNGEAWVWMLMSWTGCHVKWHALYYNSLIELVLTIRVGSQNCKIWSGSRKAEYYEETGFGEYWVGRVIEWDMHARSIHSWALISMLTRARI